MEGAFKDATEKMKHRIVCGDCLKVVHSIETNSVDLIILDSPYNINKAEWDNIPNYIEWMGTVFLECQRVLKDNGSFYFFHNDFLQLVKLQQWIGDNTEFVFKQLIVWNKRFEKANNKGYLDGFVEVNGLRNYQQMAEYISYYTFQDETGLTTVMLDTNNFTTLRQYFKGLQNYISSNKKEILDRIGQRADHCFRWNSSQWDMPTIETYQELINVFSIDTWKGFRKYKYLKNEYEILREEYEILREEYEILREEYEILREEYEGLRYTFNNQKTHHSIWNYEIEKKQGHITPKPIALIENIIKHSSNEGDIVLDPMCGSGTTLIAAERLKRNSIGIEISKEYCALSHKRLSKEVSQLKWNRERSTIEKVGFLKTEFDENSN